MSRSKHKHLPLGLALLRWVGIALTTALLLYYALLLALPYIRPEHIRRFTWLGLTMPVAVAAVAAFTVLWAVARERTMWVTLLLILVLTTPVWRRTVVVNLGGDVVTRQQADSTVELRILSYNIEMFGNYKAVDSILDFIEQGRYDIVCLQEFGHYEHQGRQWRRAESRLNSLFPYHSLSSSTDSLGRPYNRSGLAVYSLHPIVESRPVSYDGHAAISSLARIAVGRDTVLVINNHLESNCLSPADRLVAEQIDDDTIAGSSKLHAWRSVIRKLNRASVWRATQADTIAAIVRAERGPVVVAGDFNDVPQSYTYATILRAGSLRDAYVTAGPWLLYHTYNQHSLSVPIDHILLSDHFAISEAAIEPQEFADHFPITAVVRL